MVCIDTQILCWAIIGQTTSNTESLVLRANHLLKQLEENKSKLIIPSIAVAEMLTSIDENDHSAVLARFQTDWRVVDFNLRAAAIFARMRRDWHIKNRLKEIREFDSSVTRKELVADVMIIASAIAHNASIIYSHNDDFRKMAEGFITVEDLPDNPIQLELI